MASQNDFVNLMPHAFNLYGSPDDGKNQKDPILTVPPSGFTARLVETIRATSIEVDPDFADKYPYGLPPVYQGVIGLPDTGLDGKTLIVSMLVGEYYRASPSKKPANVKHVVGPDSGTGCVRDSKGAIIGTVRFIVYV